MRVALLLASMFFSLEIFASGFTAICEADKVHAYRQATDISGNDISNGDGWSDDEKFNGKWAFSFQGGDKLELDGKLLPIIYWDGVSMVAIDQNTSPIAVNTWAYAVNLELKEIVGSQVNSSSGFGAGIKARSMNFICEFSSE